MNNVITFDSDVKKEILSIFGKSVDKDGFLVDNDDPTRRVLSAEGEPVKLREFAGIKKGSLIFVKSDIISLIKLSDELQ